MTIPVFDATREFAAHADELTAAAVRVLTSGRYILGPEVAEFETEAARYLGASHGVGVASGTDAIQLSLKALGVVPGDQVLCPAFTFFATASAILNAGAEPVFADVECGSLNLDPIAVRALLDGVPAAGGMHLDLARLRGIVAVHLFGQPASMRELRA